MNMADVEAKVFSIEVLREFCTRVFLHFGVPKNDAIEAAEVLASADLRGIDSHGVARLHSYFDMLSEGRINPKPEIDRKSTRLNSSHLVISYAVFCLKKKRRLDGTRDRAPLPVRQ